MQSTPSRGSLAYVTLLTVVAALGGLLFGYDTAVISGATGFLESYFELDRLTLESLPEPVVRFGETFLRLDAADSRGFWKGWMTACALLGCAVGAGLAGFLSDRLGRKRVLVLSAIAFLVSAVGTALPWSFGAFVVFRIIGGLGIGAASIVSPMYIAEVSPAAVRGRMVSVNQFAIVTGMVLVYFVNYFIAAYGTKVDTAAAPATVAGAAAEKTADVLPRDSWNVQRGWRWMFGSGALPSLLLLGMLFAVPESPRWLVKQSRPDEALDVLRRISGSAADGELAAISQTVAHESSSLRQLFQPGMRAALVIGVVLAVFQQVTGINVFLYFAPEIFKKMGAGGDVALLQTVVVGAVNLGFTVLALGVVDRLGRKPLMLLGSTGMGLSLVALGLAAFYGRTETWVLVFILSYIGCFALSVGPVTWVILSEIYPTRIRGRAMAIATVCLWVANFIVTQSFMMMDENRWLIERFNHAFPFFVYAVLAFLSVVFVWFFIPETKGKTLEEIERTWTGG